MGFLAPAFLAGLAALSIPVFIHLINRERKEVVPFPSLMFLQKIPYRSVRRQKLRHILLLTLRCLALAIVVAAFARPFLRRDKVSTSPAAAGARELVVLVDRSYSMGYGDRWQRAIEAARHAVASVGATDRATIVAFDETAAAVTPPTSSQATLSSALGALRVGAEGTRYGPALKLAAQILAGSNLPRREVVLVSDFQRRGWARPDEAKLPPTVRFTPVDVGGDPAALPDLGLTSVSLQRSDSGARDQVIVAARVTNTGAAAVDLPMTLAINGRDDETQSVNVPAHGAAQVRFARIAIPSGTSSGIVRLGAVAASANRLTIDDRFYFTVSPDAEISVLVLEPPSARPSQSLYLRRALEIGDRPSFRVDVKPASAFVPADLAGRSLVVLDEVGPPGGETGARLRAFVQSGGGVLVVAGDRFPGVSGEWTAVMPGGVGAVVDRSADAGATLAWVDYGHPVFELFNAPHSGDFSSARFLRYRALSVRADSASRADSTPPRVLARFDDGSAALVERQLGSGRIAVWGSTIDAFWNDLPLQPVFLPFVHELAKYEGRFNDERPWFTAGDVLDLSRHAELTTASGRRTPAGGVLVESPSGARTRYESSASALVPLHEQGLYEIRDEHAAPGTGRRVAVNVDPAESELARLDTAELRSAITNGAGMQTAGARVVDAPSREEQEKRQTLWWYLLAMAGVLLAAETMLSNRLSRA